MNAGQDEASAAADKIVLPCKEFSEFKSALQQARTIDDKIVYNLNTSVPTESFAGQVSAREQCMSLYKQLLSVHKERTGAITACVESNTAAVTELKEKMAVVPESEAAPIKKKLSMLRRKLRLMENEFMVEEAVQERSMKVFKERCWKSYRPPDDA